MNKGKNKIKKYLLTKGISNNVLDEILSEFLDELYNEEILKVKEILEKNKDIPVEKIFRKLITMGYSYSVVYKVVKTKLK